MTTPKKIVTGAGYITLSAILTFSLLSIVYAEDSASTTEGTSFKESIREKIEERKDIIETKKEAVQENITERKSALRANVQDRIFNLSKNITNRMQAAIIRIEDISKRLDSRLTKMLKDGYDVEEAQSLLNDSNAARTRAEIALEGIDTIVEQAITSDDARTSFIDVRNRFKQARTEIIRSHELLRAAVIAAKAATQTVTQEEAPVNQPGSVSSTTATSTAAE